jgi:hypothetical protein
MRFTALSTFYELMGFVQLLSDWKYGEPSIVCG